MSIQIRFTVGILQFIQYPIWLSKPNEPPNIMQQASEPSTI